MASEQLEALARFMGWTKSKVSKLVPASRHTDEMRWWIEGGAPVANVAEWNPFTDANADVQVLERAREVWPGTDEMLRFATALHVAHGREYVRAYALHSGACTNEAAYYRTGDYARAVLAVLRTEPRE